MIFVIAGVGLLLTYAILWNGVVQINKPTNKTLMYWGYFYQYGGLGLILVGLIKSQL